MVIEIYRILHRKLLDKQWHQKTSSNIRSLKKGTIQDFFWRENSSFWSDQRWHFHCQSERKIASFFLWWPCGLENNNPDSTFERWMSSKCKISRVKCLLIYSILQYKENKRTLGKISTKPDKQAVIRLVSFSIIFKAIQFFTNSTLIWTICQIMATVM